MGRRVLEKLCLIIAVNDTSIYILSIVVFEFTHFILEHDRHMEAVLSKIVVSVYCHYVIFDNAHQFDHFNLWYD